MELQLTDSVGALHGVGPRRAVLYQKLGVSTIFDLLTDYPRTYLDFTSPVPILDTVLNETNVIHAVVYRKQGEQRIRKGLSLFKVFVRDDSGELTVTIFNSKYQFAALQEGQEYYFYGKVTGTLLRREMSSPLFFPAMQEDRILPVYNLTEGLSNKLIQQNVKEALAVWGDRLTDDIPAEIRKENGLCPLRYAIENIHFPAGQEALTIARKRLIFGELLILQLGLSLLRKRSREETGIRLINPDITPFLNALPFTLTNGQLQAIRDGLSDMQSSLPMNRLIQGDVGSGKTMVAAALCYACSQNGFQSAVMAPTQILAEQHYQTFSKQLAPLGVKCCLLTGSLTKKQRAPLLEGIAKGEYAVVIGTHALLQQDVTFASLGLVVTDEQHRFGVRERSTLVSKGDSPHLLVMSATPIPRTLALILYGDLDISSIRELPKGRQPVSTFAIDSGKRARALFFLKKEVDAGRQAYIVCPLIEEGQSDLVSIRQYISALKKTPLASYRIEPLNGKLKPAEKEARMVAFQSGEIQILVSTTVIEVGIDIPNANVMLIENAERFGLSQLHQLRGRVGRGEFQSYCILVSDNRSEDVRKRLHIMTQTSDGFQIAEEDLKLRGPGDFFGYRQHGLPTLKIANLATDMELLKKIQEISLSLLEEDPALTQSGHLGLHAMVKRLFAQKDQLTLN